MVDCPTIPDKRGEVEQHPAERGNARAADTARDPAAAVTGTRASLHSRETAATCSVECGRTITDVRVTWLSSAQIIASGHQSRLASLTSAAAVETAAPVAAS